MDFNWDKITAEMATEVQSAIAQNYPDCKASCWMKISEIPGTCFDYRLTIPSSREPKAVPICIPISRSVSVMNPDDLYTQFSYIEHKEVRLGYYDRLNELELDNIHAKLPRRSSSIEIATNIHYALEGKKLPYKLIGDEEIEEVLTEIMKERARKIVALRLLSAVKAERG